MGQRATLTHLLALKSPEAPETPRVKTGCLHARRLELPTIQNRGRTAKTKSLRGSTLPKRVEHLGQQAPKPPAPEPAPGPDIIPPDPPPQPPRPDIPAPDPSPLPWRNPGDNPLPPM